LDAPLGVPEVGDGHCPTAIGGGKRGRAAGDIAEQGRSERRQGDKNCQSNELHRWLTACAPSRLLSFFIVCYGPFSIGCWLMSVPRGSVIAAQAGISLHRVGAAIPAEPRPLRRWRPNR